jgi:hypothetical protein
MRQAIRKARGHDKILEYFLPYNKGLSTRTGGSISSACSLPQLRISTFLERYQSDQIDSSTGLPFRAQHYCRLQFPPLPLQHWPVRRTMKNPLAKNLEELGYRGTCTTLCIMRAAWLWITQTAPRIPKVLSALTHTPTVCLSCGTLLQIYKSLEHRSKHIKL